MQSMLVEENVQYFLMAVFWWRSTPMIGKGAPWFTTKASNRTRSIQNEQLTFNAFDSFVIAPLIPYAVFAFFNAINYTRTSILPAIFPAGSTDPKASQAAGLSRKIQTWSEKNHGPAMAFVAYVEVIGVMGSLILGAIT